MPATVLTTAAPGRPAPPPKKPADRPFLQRRQKKQRAKQAKKEQARAEEQANSEAIMGLIPKNPKQDPAASTTTPTLKPKRVRSKLPKFRKLARGTTQAQATWKYLRKGDK
ncbi:unnamed protein product [Penicillium nalgiovense]|uniref:Uncharacterized protein n=1 Tax=Penicillium nalgiovense TaxID=60175 RepID=A0A9W4MMP3_PENNA|nr:unnamed protein product [Penicillium nalgiovense]CAG7958694.1 unnamed protein product [Penicillium nalgiovense]CAG7959166.1 unnamed protein product [Penicillium nalgiovense]CAG7959451.1 unnamed protein product [Penicillium nalgiovense]CAG7967947.1 unnamed protein product [Penicillium nalgiovense]